MSEELPTALCSARIFTNSPEHVFDAWLDPLNVGEWLFATPTGNMVRVEIDPRVGGHFSIVDRRGEDDVEHTGEYLAIERSTRLVFTLLVPKFSTFASRVSVEIQPTELGCELTLTHELPSVPPEIVEGTKKGWSEILEGLDEVLKRW